MSVLRKVGGPKGVEGAGDWGKLCNEELHDFCSSPNIRVRRMIWGDVMCVHDFCG